MQLNKQIVIALVGMVFTMSACNTKKQEPEPEVAQTSVENPTVESPKVTTDGLVIITGACTEGNKVELSAGGESLIDVCDKGAFKFVISQSLSGLQVRQINGEGNASEAIAVK